MKIKKRIKRVLAACLRDELLEYIGYNHKIPFMSLEQRFCVENVQFETKVMETIIPIEIEKAIYDHNPTLLEEKIQKCKEDFSRQIVDHIHVDAQDLLDPNFFRQRSVKFTLRVQSKK